MATWMRPRLSPEAYLRIEREADTKSEYLNGEMYLMAGASEVHNTITFNLARELGNQLRRRPCRAYVSDMRVKVSETGAYTYPDLVALCEEARFEDSHVDTLINPAVIFEVLSPTTEALDRGAKFSHYRRLASLQEYVLVSQDRVQVEQYTRQGERWILAEYSSLGDSVSLPSIGCVIPLGDIYDNVRIVAPPSVGEELSDTE